MTQIDSVGCSEQLEQELRASLLMFGVAATPPDYATLACLTKLSGGAPRASRRLGRYLRHHNHAVRGTLFRMRSDQRIGGPVPAEALLALMLLDEDPSGLEGCWPPDRREALLALADAYGSPYL